LVKPSNEMSDWLLEDISISTAAVNERPQALELLVSRLDEPIRSEQLGRLAHADVDGWPALDGLIVARRGARLVGACLAVPHPGKTASVWPPEISAGEPESTAAKLLHSVLEFLARHGTRVAQALLDTDAGLPAARLAGAGFIHAADLLFLVCGREQFPTSPPGDRLRFDIYRPEDHLRLAKLVERSYEGTLDCPRLNGIRETADVLDGYRRTGVFDPARWLLVREGEKDIGCLLLTEHPAESQWEIVYMGLIPEARGHGLGRWLIQQAQWRASQAECPRLVAAVDAENEPALRAYASCGFAAWDRRSVYLTSPGSPNIIR
jgi:mycothiol synthase